MEVSPLKKSTTKAAKRPESAEECVLSECPNPSLCHTMSNCDAYLLRRQLMSPSDGEAQRSGATEPKGGDQ